MTEKELNETKDKILTVARVLFADHGFEGTSVRDIAKAADVNVASVNYHFTSKEGLFAEILQKSYLECSNDITLMYQRQQPSLEDSLVFIFRYFTDKSHDLITHFKMMISSQHSHHQIAAKSEDEFFGPPGGKVIAEAILKEAGTVSDEDLHWALKSLFSHVVHTAILYNCCFKGKTVPFTSDEDIEKNIRRLCRVVIKDLKKN